MSSLNAGEATASQFFALTCRGLLFFAMIGRVNLPFLCACPRAAHKKRGGYLEEKIE
jgi:hypothetical protein